MANNKLIKFLSKPLISGLLKSIPFGIGSVAGNVLSEHKGVGNVDQKELAPQLLKILIYVVLLYLIFNGKLSFEEASQYKEFISQ